MHGGDGVVTLGIAFRSQIAYRVKCMEGPWVCGGGCGG